MIKVAINGYGTIGKRVADAVAAQKDMKVIGVSKTRPNAEAFIAKLRGYPLYIADISKKAAFEKAGLAVAGSVEEMCKAADVIVDATPGGIGASNKPLYEKLGKKGALAGWRRSRNCRVLLQLVLQFQGCRSAGSLSGSSPATQPAFAGSSTRSTRNSALLTSTRSWCAGDPIPARSRKGRSMRSSSTR